MCQRIANIHADDRKWTVDVAAQKNSQDEARANAKLDDEASAKCDLKARAKREKWLVTAGCKQKVTSGGLDCSDQMIHNVDGDSPWVAEAKAQGFTRFVCREVASLEQNGSVTYRREVERSIDWVITTRPKSRK
ncbi:MAG: hypothetical protein QM831_11600 [Kofleriaceae bacterium]